MSERELRKTNLMNLKSLCKKTERIQVGLIYRTGDSLNQWRRQNFSLEGAKLKDDIKSEINLKNINQQ